MALQVGSEKSGPMVLKYREYANLKIKIETCGWRCSKVVEE